MATTPSPTRTERVTVEWADADLPTAGEAGYGAGTLPLSHLVNEDHRPSRFVSGLPTIVFLYTEVEEEKALTFEDSVFGDERVGLSSRFFNCIRISLDDIPSESVRKQYTSGKGPAIFVLDAEGKELKRLTGWKTSGARLYKTMSSVLKARSKISLASLLRKEGQFLKKIDEAYWKLEDAKFDLNEMASRKGKSAERQRQKLEAKIVALKADYKKLLDAEAAFIKQADEKVVADD